MLVRILLAHKLWELTGGAEVFFRETERVLREAGHETMMVATGLRDETAPDNLILLEAPNYKTGNLFVRFAHLPSAIYDRKKRSRVIEIIQDFQPDIMHIFGINVHLSLSLIDAAEEAGLPVVATFNDYKHICPNYKLFANDKVCYSCKGRKFHSALRKNCCKGSWVLSGASMVEAYIHSALGLYEKISHFTFSSDFMAQKTQEFWPERKLSWSKLRNPFESSRYEVRDDQEPFALYFGRIIAEKGVDRIIDAAGEVGGYQIRIIGNGPDEADLRARAKREGLANVEFLGPKWGKELENYLARSAFVIVPSIWHENFPYVINQSFAFGRPVIGSRRGGIPELIKDGVRGLVFEPDEPGALAASIRTLAEDPERTSRMGWAAKRYSDALFNDETTLKSVLHAYERGTYEFRRRRR